MHAQRAPYSVYSSTRLALWCCLPAAHVRIVLLLMSHTAGSSSLNVRKLDRL